MNFHNIRQQLVFSTIIKISILFLLFCFLEVNAQFNDDSIGEKLNVSSNHFTLKNILNYPESVVFDTAQNNYYVSCQGTGAIVKISDSGLKTYFTTGHTTVLGITISGDTLFAVCNNIVKGFLIEDAVKVFEHAIPEAIKLNDIVADKKNHLFISDVLGHKIYQINVLENTHKVLTGSNLNGPNGLLIEENKNRILVVSWSTNSAVQSVDLTSGETSIIHELNLTNCDGIAKDNYERYYISEWETGCIHSYNSNFTEYFGSIYQTNLSPADIFFNEEKQELAIPLVNGHSVEYVPISAPLSTTEILTEFEFKYQNPITDFIDLNVFSTVQGYLEMQVLELSTGKVIAIHNEFILRGENHFRFDGDKLSNNVYCVFITIWNNSKKVSILSKYSYKTVKIKST